MKMRMVDQQAIVRELADRESFTVQDYILMYGLSDEALFELMDRTVKGKHPEFCWNQSNYFVYTSSTDLVESISFNQEAEAFFGDESEPSTFTVVKHMSVNPEDFNTFCDYKMFFGVDGLQAFMLRLRKLSMRRNALLWSIEQKQEASHKKGVSIEFVKEPISEKGEE